MVLATVSLSRLGTYSGYAITARKRNSLSNSRALWAARISRLGTYYAITARRRNSLSNSPCPPGRTWGPGAADIICLHEQ